uniref:Shikimate dehydrogenase n=1 Tax=Solibacter usitatus (strain Ellin6076) TaxID=234267 RepID=Q022M9_SOLUE
MNDRSRLLLGLIGAGMQSSLTPAMHEREAAEHGLVCLYQLIDLACLRLSASALPELLTAAERMGFDGLNITHPCKQSVLPLLEHVSSDAAALGAVNTVVLRDGRRWGHNTDWLAFSASFRSGLPGAPIGRIVQLGAGGAGAATAYAMLKMGAGHITIVDLDPPRADALAARCGALFREGRISVSADPAASLASADGLIHATPTGMHGHPGSAIPAELLRGDLWVAEVVYFPLETELLRAARAAGCRTLDGSGMAVHQAVEAFRLFTGLEPDAERMRRHFATMVQAR